MELPETSIDEVRIIFHGKLSLTYPWQDFAIQPGFLK